MVSWHDHDQYVSRILIMMMCILFTTGTCYAATVTAAAGVQSLC